MVAQVLLSASTSLSVPQVSTDISMSAVSHPPNTLASQQVLVWLSTILGICRYLWPVSILCFCAFVLSEFSGGAGASYTKPRELKKHGLAPDHKTHNYPNIFQIRFLVPQHVNPCISLPMHKAQPKILLRIVHTASHNIDT